MNDKKIKKIILGGAIGNCVHVAGVYEYLRLAEKVGYKTEFIGPAVTPVSFVKAIAELKPDIVCVSYRLTPKVLYDILKSFFDELNNAGLLEGRLYYFGGTPECVNVAKQFSYFSQYFIGEEKLSYLIQTLSIDEEIAGNIKGKIEEKPMLEGGKLDARQLREMMKDGLYLPMLRHHFGLPSLEDSLNGIRKIAESEQVDIISLAPDQNAQEFFFEPEKMDRSLDGAGGIPIRSEEDMIRISEARMAGNYPRLKIYAGTTNLLKWAEMSVRLLNVAWGTIPLFWYSILDGRSKRPLEIAISENQEVIRWYAENGIPVEINDPHQWGLRETSDVITAVDGYLVAYNAKKLGVKTYIAQYMFNTPRLTSGKMDIAKMLAMSELINELEDDNFIHLKMVRAGLTHFSTDMDIAKGQLASSTLLALALKPQIIHVVSFSEASHAATPENVIESCKIVKGVLKNAWNGFPDLASDQEVIDRKEYILEEARKLLKLMRDYSQGELSDPKHLSELIKTGFLDAPHLKGNPEALGQMKTLPINGGYESVDVSGKSIKETDRVQKLIAQKEDGD